ncbi:MAG: hypothetical protein NT075_07845 [Chloroflexi bacterium]|nr:hypothetical protein [Chloroflexota bacterium]
MPPTTNLGKTMLNKLIFIPLLIMLYLTSCADRFVPEPNPPISPLLAIPTHHLVPTYTPTATFTPTPLPTVTPMPVTTAVSYSQFIKLKPTCNSAQNYTQCHDPLLDISFEYPTEWGNITATLGNAIFGMQMSGSDLSSYEYAGYTYAYDFGHHFAEPQLTGVTNIIATGRSSVFSVPRDGSAYNFGGFAEQDTNEFCKNSSNPHLCRVIKSGVIVAFSFPKAEYFCIMSFAIPPPTGFVYINLPNRRLINGFMFAYPLLSLTEEKSLYGILGIEQNITTNKCDDIQAKKQFDQRVEKLVNEITAGNADDDILQRVNKLTRLANSIEGQETSR